ncbi:hypothetical protein J4476_01865 [Candidatus Woesearchaeota archaeon]|nr:MAG: hypothetical protein QT09_C0016G0014 [archaeon GW2011_AR18]MBS3161421.1 hypothetical protein [Candidatus Woesearchaeota archaeon]HIH25870.1 hypothetical protein [Nanoarchaeota archaeon]
MEIVDSLEKKTLLKVFKEFSIEYTITGLSKELKVSRVGLWKILKKLENNKLIKLKQVGNGKTSTYIIEIEWNKITEKRIELYLIEESFKQQRWLNNFEDLEKITDFLILYGSIIHSPEQANDIDILGVTSKKNNLINIQKTIYKIQKSQVKHIHSINFTVEEFKNEIKNHNKAFIESINKGIVLYGQEKFVKFMKEMHNG